MKKSLVLVAALALATTGAAFAQTARPMKSPEVRADHRAAKLAKELGLAPDQEARVEQILLAQSQEMTAARSKVQAGGDRKEAGAAMKATKEKYDAQLREAMSAEQFAKFETMRKEQHEKMREHRAEMNGKG